MNCKPGDLAIIVRVGMYTQSALGKIITVERVKNFADYAAWEYSPKIICGKYEIDFVEDICLRPLRNTPGQDEIAKIANKSVKQREPA